MNFRSVRHISNWSVLDIFNWRVSDKSIWRIPNISHLRVLRNSHLIHPFLLAAFLAIIIAAPTIATEPASQRKAETKYLLFQLFLAEAARGFFPPQTNPDDFVDDLINHIGSTGNSQQRLGFAIGPICFNQNDDEVRRLIRHSFQIALAKNVAVAFHIDSHIFWDKQKQIYDNKNNYEWSDWKGTVTTGARLDWSKDPMKAPAQMCFNSPAIKVAVKQRANLIGVELKRGIEELKAAHKEDLFAGVMTGWETRIGRDFATNRSLGYHALSNCGFHTNTPQNICDAERCKVVKEFIESWASEITKAGVQSEKVYCHIAFTPQGFEGNDQFTYAERVGFATPDVAFSKYYRPGFSTYPESDSIEQIHSVVLKHGNPHWISAEGTNVVPNGIPGESTMETYLGKMFNHGATIVNIFSWGMGGDAEKNNFFRRANEGEEAISAYKKFLAGKTLIEQKRSANAFEPRKFQAKIQTIQQQIPKWLQSTKRPDLIQPMMIKLDALIKANNFTEANKQADEILNLLNSRP
ncbi:MAG: hypothetical protein K2X81_16890 [Candidatus Obscuribacterales bacterium]|nr:hypothetical protein [Candidatus Obscuribacterales bacterium]